jgi:hypothetical protein
MFISPLVAVLSLLPIGSLAAEEADVLFDGTVVAESISVEGYLDAPKLIPTTANESSYDWYDQWH